MSATKSESPRKTIERLTQERDLLKKTLTEVQESFSNDEAQLKSELATKESAIVDLSQKLTALHSDFDILYINKLSAAIAPLEKNEKTLRENLAEQEKTIETLRASLLEKTAAMSTLEQNTTPPTQAQSNLKVLKAEVDQLIKQNEDLRAHLVALIEELNTERAKYKSFQVSVENEATVLKKDHADLTADFEALSVRERELLKHIEKWQIMSETWKQERAQLQTSIATYESQIQKNSEDLAELAEVRELLTEWAAAEVRWKQDNEQLEAEVESLSIENGSLHEEIINLTRENSELDTDICKIEAELNLSREIIKTLEAQCLDEPKTVRIRDLEAQVNALQQSVGFQASMQQRQTDALNAIQRLQDELPKIRGNEKIAVQEIINCLTQGLHEPNAQAYFDSKRAHLNNQLFILQFTSKSLLSTMLNVVVSIVAFCGAGIVLSLSGNLQKNQDKYGSSLAFNLFGIVGAKQRAQGNIQAVVNALDVVYRP